MFVDAVNILTTIAMLLHAAFGCCWHHHHETISPEHASDGASVVAVELTHQHCCGHHDHGSADQIDDTEPITPSDPCDEQQCPEIGVSIVHNAWSRWLDLQLVVPLIDTSLVTGQAITAFDDDLESEVTGAPVSIERLQVCRV